jgi:hypothetical protein
MPKKKLTKAQVKKKLKQIHKLIFDLEMDKLGQFNSEVPISIAKLLASTDMYTRALKRM